MSSLDAATVGIVGLGHMGAAMADKLREQYRVLGWDIRHLDIPSVEMVAATRALPRSCQLVLLSLPSPEATRQVLLDPDFLTALAESDSVVADTSTSDPASHRELLGELGGMAARLLDAPILGRPESCGRWTIPVGGSIEALERARPALAVLASNVVHIGEGGSAHTFKLLNNMMFAAINVITAEVIGACERLGASPARFIEVVGGSAAATVSPLFLDIAPRMLKEETESVFTTRLMHKDLQLAVRMCEDGGAPLILSRALQVATSLAMERGLAEKDTSAVVELYRMRREPDAA